MVVREISQSTHGHRVFEANGITYVTFGGLAMTTQQIVAQFAMLYFRSEPICR